MSLYCLDYKSVANQKMSDGNLKDLLKKSRLKNERKNISGILHYLDPFFIQILEGEEAIVTELFNFIKQDLRHHNVKLIYKKTNTTAFFSKLDDGIQ